MPDWLGWAVGTTLTLALAALTWVAKVLFRMPRDYIPREQLNGRFATIEKKIDKDFDRYEDRMKRIEDKLDRIIEVLAKKADK